MNSINVKSRRKYVIKVNNKGETIEFDPSDLNLSSKIMKAFAKIDEIEKKLQEEINELSKMPKIKIHNIDKRDLLATDLLNQKYNECREIMDDFLGENACQKIFGDVNYLDMWNDLFYQLKPHFKKMNINTKSMQKGLVNKYSSKGKMVI